MRRIISEAIAILMVFSVMFSGMPYLAGTLDVHAASASKKIKLKANVIGQTEVTLKWNKIKKPGKGYAVFRNGKAIKYLGKKKTSFTDKGLESDSTHKYQIKTYTKKKVTKWYNKKTKKWQAKKPAKKYRGKSKKVTVYAYKKKSNAVTVRIGQAPSDADDSDNDNNNASDEKDVLKVTWKNWDGTVLYSCTAKPDEVPIYKGKDPIRPDEGKFCYTFSKWDSEPSEARYVQTYTAEYEMQLKPSGYTYDIKILNQPYYSRHGNSGDIIIYLDTDNPDPQSLAYTAFDSNGEPLRTLWGPGEYGGPIFYSVSAMPSDGTKYVDIGTIDHGYFSLFSLQVVQSNEFTLTDKITFKFYEEERAGNTFINREVASRTVSVKDYDAEESDWMQSVLDEATTPSMTNEQKMRAICAYIEEHFKYTLNNKGYCDGDWHYLYLFTDEGKPYWIRKTLNSYSSPALLVEFGKLIGYPLKNMYPVYEYGTLEWKNFHMYAYSEEEDKWYEACPYTETNSVDPNKVEKFDPNTYQFWEE